jgi:geranylgeranyl pyrophosphate synthase
VPSVEGSVSLDAWLDASRAWAESVLERRFLPRTAEAGPDTADGASTLGEAMRYSVMGGGKRLRPAVVRLACSWLGGADEDCELPAVAVELIHAYSLVHDDLPCMDDDDLRRGRPSCHVVYGEAMAILCGDALQAAAFQLLTLGDASLASAWVYSLSTAAGDAGMVGGQALDMTLARGAPAEVVSAMHGRKTAALIGAAAELGAIAARADDAALGPIRRWGMALGLLFQATDDLLDVTGDAASLGKTPGKDERHEKATLIATLGVEGTRREAERLAVLAREAALELGCEPKHVALGLVDRVLGRSS